MRNVAAAVGETLKEMGIKSAAPDPKRMSETNFRGATPAVEIRL